MWRLLILIIFLCRESGAVDPLPILPPPFSLQGFAYNSFIFMQFLDILSPCNLPKLPLSKKFSGKPYSIFLPIFKINRSYPESLLLIFPRSDFFQSTSGSKHEFG